MSSFLESLLNAIGQAAESSLTISLSSESAAVVTFPSCLRN
jgi:hypothetical protein